MNVVQLNNTVRKADLLARLQREILPLQGLRSAVNGSSMDLGLGVINDSLPNRSLPLGAVHEFITSTREGHSASSGFVSSLLSPLMKKGGTALWISAGRTIYPAALKSYGIEPERVIFIDIVKQKDAAWAMDEALKCGAISCVVGEIADLSFTASRRLQLSVEQSQVTAFLLRNNPRNLNSSACVTRWKISPLPSENIDDLPGLGWPVWNVELLKVRNGRPGTWQVKWMNGQLQVTPAQLMDQEMEELKTKTA